MCRAGSDCASSSCVGDACAAPTCADGVANGDESDVDCGGACPACGDGATCGSGADCLSSDCAAGVCESTPSCDDGVLNGGELGVDCGGPCGFDRCTVPCPDGMLELDLSAFADGDGRWVHAGATLDPDDSSDLDLTGVMCGDDPGRSSGPEVGYRFDVPTTATYRVTVGADGASTEAPAVVWVQPGYCGAALTPTVCDVDVAGDTGVMLELELTAGDVAYIVVDSPFEPAGAVEYMLAVERL